MFKASFCAFLTSSCCLSSSSVPNAAQGAEGKAMRHNACCSRGVPLVRQPGLSQTCFYHKSLFTNRSANSVGCCFLTFPPPALLFVKSLTWFLMLCVDFILLPAYVFLLHWTLSVLLLLFGFVLSFFFSPLEDCVIAGSFHSIPVNRQRN